MLDPAQGPHLTKCFDGSGRSAVLAPLSFRVCPYQFLSDPVSIDPTGIVFSFRRVGLVILNLALIEILIDRIAIVN